MALLLPDTESWSTGSSMPTYLYPDQLVRHCGTLGMAAAWKFCCDGLEAVKSLER